MLAAKLRRANIDPSADTVEELARLIGRIHAGRNTDAIAAAIGTPWSSGLVEGQTTRLNAIKRSARVNAGELFGRHSHAYGRAGFALLRQRALMAA